MIVCPNCNHQNPEGATQCEACYTPLPATIACPNCGASVQTDAGFCGQCGFNLKVSTPVAGGQSAPTPLPIVPDLGHDPFMEPPMNANPDPVGNPTNPPNPDPTPIPATIVSQPPPIEAPEPDPVPLVHPPETPVAPMPLPVAPINQPPATSTAAKTQLQVPSAQLFHIQTNTVMELPTNLAVIHVGKPNDQIPPDIDVSGFPNSDIVSRIHADIRVEGDSYFIEDVGSSNGTYVNHTPLSRGNRHRLRAGDRISLGKGDQVTFLFQNT